MIQPVGIGSSRIAATGFFLVALSPAIARTEVTPAFPRMSPDWQEALLEVRARLEAEGLSEADLEPLVPAKLFYVDKAVEMKMLSLVGPSRKPRTYFNQRSFRRASVFMKEHEATLALVEEDYGVAPSVIAAILWIETHYGDFKPIFPTLSTTASLAAMSVPRIAKAEASRARARAREKGYAGWDQVDWDARASAIGERWLGELKFLLELNRRLEWPDGSLENVRGSWASAIGHGQFLPSTAVRNLDCGGTFWRANLWDWSDTIQLVARHVSENGWSRDPDRRARRESILRYNRQEAYADAVFEMSNRLDAAP